MNVLYSKLADFKSLQGINAHVINDPIKKLLIAWHSTKNKKNALTLAYFHGIVSGLKHIIE